MYTKTTRAIKITVKSFFLDERSSPEQHKFFWAYQVTIENTGQETVTLKNRYWKIIDAHGHQVEVEGEGVIGQQPTINPGMVFEYTSGTPLSTPSGFMVGRYEMHNSLGESFSVDIPAFSLDSQHQPKSIH